jgi:hypothetical protein
LDAERDLQFDRIVALATGGGIRMRRFGRVSPSSSRDRLDRRAWRLSLDELGLTRA